MRALNLGLFAVVGGIVGVSACADDPDPPEIVPGPNMPFPTGGSNTGGITATGGRVTGSGGSGNSAGGSGGRSSSSGGSSSKAATCPMDEPDDGDSCTAPTDGTTLKCVFEVTTTCSCKRPSFGTKATWDCVSSATSTGGRSGASTGTGGKATGGRAAFGQGGTTSGQGGSTGGGTAKAGGFGF
jgi:hypothetical protein